MYISLLFNVLFLQPGFGEVGLEAVDEDTVSPVWDKDSSGASRTDTSTFGKDMPSEFAEDP